jgi:hypothetical protein
MNRPGESGDSGCCLAGLGEGGILTEVGGLELGGRDVPARFAEPSVIELGPHPDGGEPIPC